MELEPMETTGMVRLTLTIPEAVTILAMLNHPTSEENLSCPEIRENDGYGEVVMPSLDVQKMALTTHLSHVALWKKVRAQIANQVKRVLVTTRYEGIWP